MLVGPPLAGLLVEHFGTASPFLFAAAVAVVDGVMRIILVKESPRVTDDAAGPLAVLRVPGSLSIVLAVVVGAAVLSGVEPVLPVHLKASSLTVGLLFGLAVLASITVNPIVGRFVAAVSPRLFVGGGVAAAATALVVIGVADEMWQTSAGMVLLGASSALLLTPSTTLMSQQGNRSVPPTLGGSFALYNLAYAGGLAGGPLLTGFAVQRAGFAAAMAVAATVLVSLGIVAVARLPRSLREQADLA